MARKPFNLAAERQRQLKLKQKSKELEREDREDSDQESPPTSKKQKTTYASDGDNVSPSKKGVTGQYNNKENIDPKTNKVAEPRKALKTNVVQVVPQNFGFSFSASYHQHQSDSRAAAMAAKKASASTSMLVDVTNTTTAQVDQVNAPTEKAKDAEPITTTIAAANEDIPSPKVNNSKKRARETSITNNDNLPLPVSDSEGEISDVEVFNKAQEERRARQRVKKVATSPSERGKCHAARENLPAAATVLTPSKNTSSTPATELSSVNVTNTTEGVSSMGDVNEKAAIQRMSNKSKDNGTGKDKARVASPVQSPTTAAKPTGISKPKPARKPKKQKTATPGVQLSRAAALQVKERENQGRRERGRLERERLIREAKHVEARKQAEEERSIARKIASAVNVSVGSPKKTTQSTNKFDALRKVSADGVKKARSPSPGRRSARTGTPPPPSADVNASTTSDALTASNPGAYIGLSAKQEAIYNTLECNRAEEAGKRVALRNLRIEEAMKLPNRQDRDDAIWKAQRDMMWHEADWRHVIYRKDVEIAVSEKERALGRKPSLSFY